MRNYNATLGQQTTSEQQATHIIREYLGQHLRHLSISRHGRTLCADVTYTDFKPEREVRRHLEDLIPNLDFSELDRDYSNDIIVDTIYSDQTVLYVREPDGTLHPTTAADYITELLRHLDLSADAPKQPAWNDLTPEQREALIRQTAQQHDILQSSGAVKPTGNADENDNDNKEE